MNTTIPTEAENKTGATLPALQGASCDHTPVNARLQEENVVPAALRLLRKYFWLIFLSTIAGLSSAIVLNIVSPREYKANANIQLTQDTANQFRLEQAVGGDIDGAKIDTDIEVLRSSRLALQTITSLGLNNLSGFVAQPSGRKWNLDSSGDRHVLVSAFHTHLSAMRLGHTNIISISVISSDPQLSALICNELIKNYREHNFRDSYAATQEVSSWLQAQLGELHRRLTASEAKLLTLQRETGLVGVDQPQSAALIRLEALSRDLTRAETERFVVEAKLNTINSASDQVVDTLSADPLLFQLLQRRIQLADEFSGLMSRYGEANPRVVDTSLQLSTLNKAILNEEETAKQEIAKELETALHNEQALRSTLKKEQDEAYSNNSKVMTYSLARREYEANRNLYDGLQAKLQEAGIIAGLRSSSIRVIDAADVPVSPSSPRKTFDLMVGSTGGLVLGLVLSFAFASLDTHVRTISDVEDSLGLPLLGVIPQVRSAELTVDGFISCVTHAVPTGWSQMAEAYRSLRTSILLSRSGAPPQVVLVSSSQPGEGKTSIASFEAILLAISGARVLLVDADLRRPSVHTRFGILNSNGLSSVLTRTSLVSGSLHHVPAVPSLTLLPSGPIVSMPAELLGSTQMRDLLTELRRSFEFFLIDTPPALSVTDAAVLASFTDGAIVIVRYGKTARKSVARTSLTLGRAGARTLGIVINAADSNSPDYADYYGGSYQAYYRQHRFLRPAS